MVDAAHQANEPADFFVSYTQADRDWAEWVGWALESEGYRVILQAWDFGPGSHFVHEMHLATQALRTVAILSKAYQSSLFAAAEWQAAWLTDPGGGSRKLLVVRVEDCAREGLLRQVVTVDLFGVDRDKARQRLLAAARGQRGKPEHELSFPPSSEPTFPRPPKIWRVPWQRNPNFTGRSDELTALEARLKSESAITAVLPQTLHGLGGVGKTQLAVEYTYRYSASYDLVWWVPGEEPASGIAALAALAERLDVATVGAALESALAAVEYLRRAASELRWLVVVDNAAEPSQLWGLLSAAGGSGHVIITSRDPRWSSLTQSVEVDVLPRSDSIALLRRRAPRLTEAEADHIAELLGDLPLALEQAGAWLSISGMSVAVYADAVAHRTSEILAEGTPLNYPVPVAATWTLAIENFGDLAAVFLLQLWAIFGPEPIPIDLIDASVPSIAGTPLEQLSDPINRGRTIGRIFEVGWVRLAGNDIIMHRLVQAVVRDQTPVALVPRLRAIVHELLAAAIPSDPADPHSWPRYSKIYPHAVATDIVGSESRSKYQLVEKLSEYLGNFGDSRSSLALASEAYHRWRDDLGADDPDVINAEGNLASYFSETGDSVAARELDEDTLERSRRILVQHRINPSGG